MIQLSLAEAAERLQALHDQLLQDTPGDAATITEDGKPVLAVLPWELFETLLEIAQLPRSPKELLAAPADIRQRMMALSTAMLYAEDRALTDFDL